MLPPVIVSPEIDAVTLASTWNTRLSPPPLTVTPAAGPVIVCVPVVSLSSSWVPLRVIVCGVLKTVAVEGDRVGPRGRIRHGDRLAQVDLAGDGRVGGVVHDERGQQPAVLQRHQRRPHPPPFPGLDRPAPRCFADLSPSRDSWFVSLLW